MLNLYHDLGAVIYFRGDDHNTGNNGLSDIIILDPKWLIDVFKGVITVEPYAKQVSQYFCCVDGIGELEKFNINPRFIDPS